MNTSRALVQVLAGARQLSTSAARRGTQDVHPGYKKTWAKYAHFQKDDGVPVHLKNGFPDRALFGLTVILTAAGLLGCVDFYYHAAMPKKND